ncbi:MAG: AAA family ATPase [Treponema sp.]|nr:AAA family ATPase [Treponema sp.]
MFLKRLDVFGFKSFADRTQVEFAEGITALLGPNGCGKSNVVDAVKWVLGEQASRALRAEKMEDVIFNGTENRKALNVAEVTLTIANETGFLPLDMPEVEIKRRLYRSGESEYYINTQPVRLRELRELFWDTGVGKGAYSVMEQGRIDQILSSKPEDRRYLFEEAAGITRYKLRGAEAERNLAKTEENKRQVEGVLGEIRRSYDSLKVQSEKTVKYRALRDDIFNLELDIQLLRLKQFKYERDSRKETFARREAERDSIRAEMEAANKSLEEKMDEVNLMEGKLVDYQKSIYGLVVEKNAREKEGRLLAEQRGEIQEKIGENQGRERVVQEKIEALNADAREQEAAVGDLKKKAAGIEENIAAFQENIRIASSRIGDNEQEVLRLEDEIRRAGEEQAVYEKDLAAITDDIVAALDAGLKEAGYSAAERRSLEAELSETLGRLRALLAGRETLIRDLAAAAGAAAERGGAGGPGAEELAHIASGLAGVLEEAAAGAGRAMELFEGYRKSSPAFIDDFLTPEGIITQKRGLDAKIRLAKEGIEERRNSIGALRRANAELGERINEYRKTLEDLRVSRARMEAQAHSAEEQARLIRRELAGQQGHLETIRVEIAAYRRRLEETNSRIAAAGEEIAGIERKSADLAKELEKLGKDIARQNGDVAGKQAAIKKRAAELAKVQAALERTGQELVQSETEIKNIQDNFRETHSRDLLEFEERTFTITASPAEMREKLAGARERLRTLGSVNLMAPEEFAEVKERFDFLNGQLEDLNKARRDLENLTREIRAESRDIFISAYNKIKRNFHNMFRRLFGGGRAELQLLDENHVLESGIEIYAQPPGKKLENINLLSGGEKSMTAVALLFATHMVRPSPFCLLDEIDAALDEANVGRFVQVLREFARLSQFIVITHNKRTISGASTLLGVTMEESGVSKMISTRLENSDTAAPLPEAEPYEEEDVEYEDGRELPAGIDDPAQVSEVELRPIRAGRNRPAVTVSGVAGSPETPEISTTTEGGKT